MSRNTVAEVISCAEKLCRAIERAPTGLGFDENGDGPFTAIGDAGRVRLLAIELENALLTHERLALAEGR